MLVFQSLPLVLGFILLLNKDRGYNITMIQDGTTVKMQSADTTTNTIFIKQGAN